MAEHRRRFITRVMNGVGLALAAIYAVPALRYLRGDRAAADEPAIDVGTIADLPEGVPHKVALANRTPDAWSEPTGAHAAIYLLRSGAEVRALDAACPHTGCAVAWEAAQREFVCPCHKSAFSVEGARLAGPAPRGLDPQSVEIRAGRILVRYRRQRPGRPDRVPA